MADNPYAKWDTGGGDSDGTTTTAAPAAPATNPYSKWVDPAESATPKPGPVDRREPEDQGWFHNYIALPFQHFIASGARTMIPVAQGELAMAPGITYEDMPKEGDVNKLVFGSETPPPAPNATSGFLSNVAEGIGVNPPLAMAMPLTTLGGTIAGETTKEAGGGPVLSTLAAMFGGGVGGALEHGLTKVLTSIGDLSRTALGTSAKDEATEWLKTGMQKARDKIDSDLADKITNASNLRSISPPGPPGSWQKTLDGLFKEANDAKDELVSSVKGHFEDIANAANPEKAFDKAMEKLDVLRQHAPGLASRLENTRLAHVMPRGEGPAASSKAGTAVDSLGLGVLGELLGHEAVPWATNQLQNMMTPEAIQWATPALSTIAMPLAYMGVKRIIGNELTNALRLPTLVGGVAGGGDLPADQK